MKRIKNKIISTPSIFYLIACGIALVIILSFDLLDKEFSYHDILVEAHGLIYDLFVFGILLAIYDSIKSKKDKINKLEEEIEDFREWKKEEATHKIVGNIRRLYELGVTKFYLNGCYLNNANLSEYNFTNSYFSFAKMANANLLRSDFKNAQMVAANLENAHIVDASFENANLEHANFTGAKLTSTNFNHANLSTANLSGVIITYCNFKNANMKNVKLKNSIVSEVSWLKSLKIENVKGAKKLNKKFYVDKDSRFIKNELVFYRIKKRKKIKSIK